MLEAFASALQEDSAQYRRDAEELEAAAKQTARTSRIFHAPHHVSAAIIWYLSAVSLLACSLSPHPTLTLSLTVSPEPSNPARCWSETSFVQAHQSLHLCHRTLN